LVRVGPTPKLLQSLGLEPSDLMMATGKIAFCRREHSQVTRAMWHDLPHLIEKPMAVVPSSHRDGSLVVVLVISDVDGDPVVVVVKPGNRGSPNIILSVYGKANGHAWTAAQIKYAAADSLPHFVSKGFAAALPQPPVANATSSSHGLIPSDGTAKPARDILSIGKKSTNS
jgi:Phage MuF-C-terminal domain